MNRFIFLVLICFSCQSFASEGHEDLRVAIDKDYSSHLGGLFKHFHANPELSTVEHKTAARMAQ